MDWKSQRIDIILLYKNKIENYKTKIPNVILKTDIFKIKT
jgi:hypothetical protein